VVQCVQFVSILGPVELVMRVSCDDALEECVVVNLLTDPVVGDLHLWCNYTPALHITITHPVHINYTLQ